MIGLTLGHYRIVEKIGAGGMGEVYRAHDEQLDRDVAVKVLPGGALRDDAARRRFRKEALALAKLNHPNIETVFEFGTHDEVDYLVTEYIPGVTLSERLASGPLAEKELVRLGPQLAEGLAAAHAQNVVHRDLKPANLRVTPDGRLKILDFGLAKLLRPASEQDATASVTETHGAAGTLAYMAPEQLQGEPVDLRSDIYAAGAVLYEMATARRSFPETHAAQLTDAILHQSPVSPRALNPRLSPEWERITLKCMEKDPDNRYQSARELVVDLRNAGTRSAAAMAQPVAQPKASWRRLTLGAGIAVVVLAGILLVLNTSHWRERVLGRGSPPRIESLAVMPLENLSRDPEQEYFADGMTDELTTDLGKISSLRVISRTSAMQYKGVRKPLPQVGRELNVGAVIEGSVLRSGNRVRITAQLIEAPTDRHLWAESYERDLGDVLALQDDVARAIAWEIKIKLTPQEQTRLASVRPVSPEVHELYLKGRYYWNKRTNEGLKKALDYFQQATEKDPNYALAYAGLADSYFTLGDNASLPPRETHPKAKAAALKALAIDDSLAEPHATLAGLMDEYDFNQMGAEAEFKRAIELNRSYATAHHWYAWYLARMGRVEESIAEIQRARELDPLSLIINTNVGRMLFYARRYDQAIEQYKRTLEMDPNFPWAHYLLGAAYAQKAMYEESIAEHEKSLSPTDFNSIRLAGLGRAYALAGRKNEALKVLEHLRALPKQQYLDPGSMVLLYQALGNRDEAYKWLERAYEERSVFVSNLKADPRFDPLRQDPRFQDLLRRIGLPR